MSGPGQGASSAAAPRRVLIVDDDLTLEVAQLSLEAVGGWAVTTAVHGRRDCAGLAPSVRTRSSWM